MRLVKKIFGIIKFTFRKLKLINNSWRDDLESSSCHLDLFPDNVFFNEKYNDFNTIFDSYEELLEKIENVISELNNEATYNKRSKKIHEFFNTIYSLNKLNKLFSTHLLISLY